MANNVEINLKAKTVDFETGFAKATEVLNKFSKSGGDINKALTTSFNEINKAAKNNLDELQKNLAAFNVKSDLKINFNTQVLEKAKDSVQALFNKIQQGTPSIDEMRAAVNKLNLSLAEIDSKQTKSQFKTLGVISTAEIEASKIKIISAYDEIQRSGVASANDITRAHEAMVSKITELDGLLITEAEKTAAIKINVAHEEALAEIKIFEDAVLMNQKFEYEKQRAAEKTAAIKIASLKEVAERERASYAAQGMSDSGASARLIGQPLAGSDFTNNIKSQMEESAAATQLQSREMASYAAAAMQGEAAAARLAGNIHAGSEFISQLKSQMEPIPETVNRVKEGINGWSIASVAAIAKIQIMYQIINSVMGAISELPHKLMASVEDYNSSVVANAATITSMAEGVKDVGAEYIKNKAYAAAVQSELVGMSATTIASAEQLHKLNNEFVLQGVYLDVNNEKQKQGFLNVANAVAVIGKTMDNENIQFSEQVRQMMEGVNKPNARLYRTLLEQDALLKQHLETWRAQGTVLEHIGPMLSGYAAATGDISNLWTTVKTTLDSITNMVLRGGFAEGFADIVKASKEILETMKENKEAIQAFIRDGFRDLKSIVSTMWEFRDGIKATAEVALWTGIAGGIMLVIVKLNELWAAIRAVNLATSEGLLPKFLALGGGAMAGVTGMIGGAAILGKGLYDVSQAQDEANVIKSHLGANDNGDALSGQAMIWMRKIKPLADTMQLQKLYQQGVFKAIPRTTGDENDSPVDAYNDWRLTYNRELDAKLNTQGSAPPPPKPPKHNDPLKASHDNETGIDNAYAAYSKAFDEREAEAAISANKRLLEINQQGFEEGKIALKNYLEIRESLIEANLKFEIVAKQKELVEAKALDAGKTISKTDAKGVTTVDYDAMYKQHLEALTKIENAKKALAIAEDKLNDAKSKGIEFDKKTTSEIEKWVNEQVKAADVAGKNHFDASMEHADIVQASPQYKQSSQDQKNIVDNALIEQASAASKKDEAMIRSKELQSALNAAQQEYLITASAVEELTHKQAMNEVTSGDFINQKLQLEQQLYAELQKQLDVALKYAALGDEEAKKKANEISAEMNKTQKVIDTTQKQGYDRTAQGGFQDAYKKFQETASNTGAQIASVTTNMFNSMENALIKFCQTGKLNMAQFTQAIIADLLKISVEKSMAGAMSGIGASGIFSGLGAAFSSIFDSSSSTGSLPGGDFNGVSMASAGASAWQIPSFDVGTPWVPQTGLALIHQGEAIIPAALNTPGASGVRSGSSSGSDGITQHVSIDARGADQGVEAKIQRGMNMAIDQARALVLQDFRRGGPTSKAAGARA